MMTTTNKVYKLVLKSFFIEQLLNKNEKTLCIYSYMENQRLVGVDK